MNLSQQMNTVDREEESLDDYSRLMPQGRQRSLVYRNAYPVQFDMSLQAHFLIFGQGFDFQSVAANRSLSKWLDTLLRFDADVLEG